MNKKQRKLKQAKRKYHNLNHNAMIFNIGDMVKISNTIPYYERSCNDFGDVFEGVVLDTGTGIDKRLLLANKAWEGHDGGMMRPLLSKEQRIQFSDPGHCWFVDKKYCSKIKHK